MFIYSTRGENNWLASLATQYIIGSLVNSLFFCMALCNMRQLGELFWKVLITDRGYSISWYCTFFISLEQKYKTPDFPKDRVNAMIRAVGKVALKSIIWQQAENDFQTMRFLKSVKIILILWIKNLVFCSLVFLAFQKRKEGAVLRLKAKQTKKW